MEANANEDSKGKVPDNVCKCGSTRCTSDIHKKGMFRINFCNKTASGIALLDHIFCVY